ncbi:putative inorganic phosphate cotransporter isoform X1 [Ceratitis capitata]|uniref:putative inorganic phosphate cotransporter isoform X1 n=2 Tax=Ceratitis capitata TaxID=7213 RepID=UPI000329973D|nr:putative inorganic phosphate cotransporter isoform X1 [Ceratitis capitata]
MTTTVVKGPFFGIRHLQALLIFFNIVVVYLSRLNVAVSVVAMTNANTTNPNFPEYDWNEKHKSYIISSFYWGYVLTQFPGGYLSRRFGSKIVMLGSTLCSAICSLLTPFLIPIGGWKAYCAIRIVMGLAQGAMFPAIHQHLGKWSPKSERNLLGVVSHSGTDCGVVLAMGVSGLIASSSLGWPGISYISAGTCLTWCLIWFFFGYNNAPSARLITREELLYIETDLKREENFHNKDIPVPWAAIFTSVPFLSLLVVRCAQAWGYTTLQAEIPSYMAGVLNMNIKSNALFSALPYVTMWLLSYVYLIVSDIVLTKGLTTLTVLRKVCNTIALWIPAAVMVGIGFLDEEQKTLAIVLMTLNVGLNAGATIGSTLNTIDLSSNHAGVLMGITNTIANFVPIVTPLLVGVIVTNEHDRSLWQTVFIISASIFFAGNLVYILGGSAVTQPWDAPDFMRRDNVEYADDSMKAHRDEITADILKPEAIPYSLNSSRPHTVEYPNAPYKGNMYFASPSNGNSSSVEKVGNTNHAFVLEEKDDLKTILDGETKDKDENPRK